MEIIEDRIRKSLIMLATNAKRRALCLERYTDKKRRTARRIVVIILTLLILGAALGLILNAWWPFGSSFIVAIISVFKDYTPQIFGMLSQEELKEADVLNIYYEQLLSKCEQLFYEIDYGHVSYHEASKMIKMYRDEEAPHAVCLNRIVRLSVKEDEKIKKDSNKYINELFNIENNE
jgi:hypothetical protein